jgi:hypothetical protein
LRWVNTSGELREDGVEDDADRRDADEDEEPARALALALRGMLVGCARLPAYLPWKKANWFGRDGLNCSTGLICRREERTDTDADVVRVRFWRMEEEEEGAEAAAAAAAAEEEDEKADLDGWFEVEADDSSPFRRLFRAPASLFRPWHLELPPLTSGSCRIRFAPLALTRAFFLPLVGFPS